MILIYIYIFCYYTVIFIIIVLISGDGGGGKIFLCGGKMVSTGILLTKDLHVEYVIHITKL